MHAPPPLLRAQATRTVPLLVQWLQLSAAALDPTAPPPAAAPPAAAPPAAPPPAAPPSVALDSRAVQLLVDLVAVLGLSCWRTLAWTERPTHSLNHCPHPQPHPQPHP